MEKQKVEFIETGTKERNTGMSIIDQIHRQIQELSEVQEWAEDMLERFRNDPEHWPEDAKDDLEQVIGYMQDAQHDLMDAMDQYQK